MSDEILDNVIDDRIALDDIRTRLDELRKQEQLCEAQIQEHQRMLLMIAGAKAVLDEWLQPKQG